MFGIDFSEILVIFGIALVVLGPEKLPKVANTVGRWIGRARGMARQFREQLEQESNTLRHGVDLNPEISSLNAAVKAASQPYLSAPALEAPAHAAAHAAYSAPYAEGKAPAPLKMDAVPAPGTVPQANASAAAPPADAAPGVSPSASEEAPPTQLSLPMPAAQPAWAPLPRPMSAPVELHESVWPDDGPA